MSNAANLGGSPMVGRGARLVVDHIAVGDSGMGHVIDHERDNKKRGKSILCSRTPSIPLR
jgi:hypothetical protein